MHSRADMGKDGISEWKKDKKMFDHDEGGPEGV